MYGLFLCLSFIFPMSRIENLYMRMVELQGMFILIVLANFAYALLNALILFGDLFNNRLCYALHAMPVKRDHFYCAHMTAGIAFSVIPNLLITFVLMAMVPGWGLYVWGWFAVSVGSYLFFYALAVFCVMLSGNYIGAILLYGITNFFAVLVSWYVTQVCGVFLYGVDISDELILTFCPVWKLARHSYLEVVCALDSMYPNYVLESVSFSAGFRPLAVYTLAGVVLMAVSQVLYRMRKLECAGDLVAMQKIKPVFLVLFTLTVGAFFHLFGQIIAKNNALPILPVGLTVGFIASQMLLKKQLNIWKVRNFVPLAGIFAVLAVAMGLSFADPMGLVTYMPEESHISGVRLETVTLDRRDYRYDEEDPLYCEDAESIRNALTMHTLALGRKTLQHHGSWINSMTGAFDYSETQENMVPTKIIYQMDDGSEVCRFYSVPVDSEEGRLAQKLLSMPEFVLGVHDIDELPELVDTLEYIQVASAFNKGGYFNLEDRAAMCGFLGAYYADCKAGTTAKYYMFHNSDDGVRDYLGWLFLSHVDGYTGKHFGSLEIYSSNENLMQWMEENGYHMPTREEAETSDGLYAYG